MIAHPMEDLIGRIADQPFGDSLRSSIRNIYGVATHAKHRLSAITSNANLSDQGKREAIRSAYKDDILPRFAEAAKSYGFAKAQIFGERKHLGKPTLKTDNLSISERAEVRSALRSAPDGKRMSLALELVKSREAAEAMLSGPSLALTGLSAPEMETVRKQYLAMHFAEDAARLQRYEDNIAPYKGAIDLAYLALRNASGMHQVEFDQMMPSEYSNIAKLEAAA